MGDTDGEDDYDEVYVIESHSAAAVGPVTDEDDEDSEYYEDRRP